MIKIKANLEEGRENQIKRLKRKNVLLVVIVKVGNKVWKRLN